MEANFPNYFAFGTTAILATSLLALSLCGAVVLGRWRYLMAATAAVALVFSSGCFALGWGIVHGLHGLYLEDPAERLEGVLLGVGPGINTFMVAMMATMGATLLLLVAALRRARRR